MPLFSGVAAADPKPSVTKSNRKKKHKKLSKKQRRLKKQRRNARKKRRAWKKRRRKARLKRRWLRRRGRRQKTKPGIDTLEIKQAKRHNAVARDFFMLSKYSEAAAEYKKAYAIRPHPEFLYNIGQCFAQLDTIKDQEWAIFYLNSYLKSASDEVDTKPVKADILLIKGNLKLLREEQAQERQQADKERLNLITAPTPPSDAAPRGPPVYKRWWFWGMVGAIAAGTTAAMIVLHPTGSGPVEGTMNPGKIQMPLEMR